MLFYAALNYNQTKKNEPSLVRGSHFLYKLIYKSGKIIKLN